MITVFDMETGEIVEQSGRTAAAPEPVVSNPTRRCRTPEPALQEVGSQQQPEPRMPPDLASLDIAEVLARFSRP